MVRERIGLSAFEALFHGRHKKVTLGSEIKDCFEYFDKHRPNASEEHPLILIHGSRIELRRVPEGTGYAVEMNGIVRVIGVDNIPKPEQIEMVKRIRNITFPYADYVKDKHK